MHHIVLKMSLRCVLCSIFNSNKNSSVSIYLSSYLDHDQTPSPALGGQELGVQRHTEAECVDSKRWIIAERRTRIYFASIQQWLLQLSINYGLIDHTNTNFILYQLKKIRQFC